MAKTSWDVHTSEDHAVVKIMRSLASFSSKDWSWRPQPARAPIHSVLSSIAPHRWLECRICLQSKRHWCPSDRPQGPQPDLALQRAAVPGYSLTGQPQALNPQAAGPSSLIHPDLYPQAKPRLCSFPRGVSARDTALPKFWLCRLREPTLGWS